MINQEQAAVLLFRCLTRNKQQFLCSKYKRQTPVLLPERIQQFSCPMLSIIDGELLCTLLELSRGRRNSCSRLEQRASGLVLSIGADAGATAIHLRRIISKGRIKQQQIRGG